MKVLPWASPDPNLIKCDVLKKRVHKHGHLSLKDLERYGGIVSDVLPYVHQPYDALYCR